MRYDVIIWKARAWLELLNIMNKYYDDHSINRYNWLYIRNFKKEKFSLLKHLDFKVNHF